MKRIAHLISVTLISVNVNAWSQYHLDRIGIGSNPSNDITGINNRGDLTINTSSIVGTYGATGYLKLATGEPPEIDAANWWLLDRNMSSMLLAVDTWKASQAPPPPRTPIQPVGIIFTEFGANKRPLNLEPQSDPGTDPFADRFGDPFRIDRAQWYYDARTNFETRGYSWTGFEYVGSKGVWEAVRFHENLLGVGPIHGHTNRLNINSTMRQALFGSTRP